MPDIVITPNRGTTSNPKIDFTGTSAGTIKMEVLSDGSLSWNGAAGSLFSISDSLSGSLMSVNDASGLPILEVFATDKVVMGKYNQNTLVVDGTNSRVGIGTASPTDKLTIANTSNNGITFSNASNATITSSGNLIEVAGNNLYLRPGSGYSVVVDSGNGLQVTTGDFRAPIFYDYNNTAYYSDPASTSNLNGLTVAGEISGSINGYSVLVAVRDILSGRNPNNILPTTTPYRVRYDFAGAAGQGAYTNSGGNYAGVMTFSPWTGTTASTGDASYQMSFGSSATNGGGVPQINIRNGIDSTWNNWFRFPLYAINPANNGTNTLYGSVFYDSDNSGYYCDPNSRSILNTLSIGTSPGSTYALEVGGIINVSGTNQVRFAGGPSTIQHNSSLGLSISSTVGSLRGFYIAAGGTEFLSSSTSGVLQLSADGSTTKAFGQFQAPSFYDSDNTAYYCDPASTSIFNVINPTYNNGAIGPSSTTAPTNGHNDVANSIKFLDGYGTAVPNGVEGSWWQGSVAIGNATRGFQLAGGYSAQSLWYRRGADGWQTWSRCLNTVVDPYPSNMNQYVRTTDTAQFANIGIGLSSPTQKLHFQANSFVGLPPTYNYVPTSWQRGSSGIIIAGASNSDGSGWSYGSRLIAIDQGDGLNLEFDVNSAASWTNAVMAISGRSGRMGYIGMGTVAPSQKLHVVGTAYSTSDFRAPVFYDSDNTAYKVDAASSSKLGYLNLDWNWGGGDYSAEAFTIQGTYPSITLRNTTSNSKWLMHNDGSGYIQWYHGGTWNNNTWTRYAQFSPDQIHHISSVRSPIFYDYDDTNYWIDPSSAQTSDLGGRIKYNLLVNAAGSTSGRGIALWDSFSSNIPVYGIVFATTANLGTHGNVSGDYATYFTMNGTANRGWVFKVTGGAAVASIDNSGYTTVASLGVGTAASGTSGEIRATNNVTAYYSDERLKTKLGPIENPIEKVKSLSGFYFAPNDTAMALGYKKTIDVGVSAQEVNAVMPEIIAPAPIDPQYMTVRYEKLIPLLIEAIKDQQKQIDELKALLTNK